MPGDAHNKTPLPASLLPELARCLASVGDREFNPTFLALVESQLQANQVMVFSYSTNKPACYLSYNTHPAKNANQLAQEYLESGHATDPLRPEIARLSNSDGIEVFPLAKLKETMSVQYRRKFFDHPGIVDKLTILARRGGACLGVNFYRFASSGAFEEKEAENPLLSVLGQLALLHYSDRQPQDMRSPLLSLSEREHEICEGILQGKTTEAIAWDLQLAASTVTTYRKRAYEKLGINSKSALFMMCRDDN